MNILTKKNTLDC